MQGIRIAEALLKIEIKEYNRIVTAVAVAEAVLEAARHEDDGNTRVSSTADDVDDEDGLCFFS